MTAMTKFDLLAASAIALLSASPALAQTDPAAPQDAATDTGAQQDAGGIQDIVVTAQRTSQRLQDVPIAVSAFTAENLERQQIVNSSSLDRKSTRLNSSH